MSLSPFLNIWQVQQLSMWKHGLGFGQCPGMEIDLQLPHLKGHAVRSINHNRYKESYLSLILHSMTLNPIFYHWYFQFESICELVEPTRQKIFWSLFIQMQNSNLDEESNFLSISSIMVWKLKMSLCANNNDLLN